MLPHGFWVESPERDQLYRGQRDAKWPTIPALFRRKNVKDALDQLAYAIPRIQACLPAVSEAQALAVAQHYSKELDVATWLLDITYDPRIALFFASDNSVTGDVGVVSCLVQKEWNKLSAAGTNRLGRLRVIEVWRDCGMRWALSCMLNALANSLRHGKLWTGAYLACHQTSAHC